LRFFAHDGQTVHGPAVLDELIKLPGFDGDTLVCPVGSENSSDWKPAIAYPPFREALLAPAPKLVPPPPPPPAPLPAPARSCPRCARANPEDARYCNACAERMDGTVEPPAPEPAPVPEPEPAPAFDPGPQLSVAPEYEPPPAELEPVPLSFGVPSPAAEPAPAPAPEPAAPPSHAWRKTLIASFAGAAVASGGLGWWLFHPAKHTAPPAADLSMPAPAPAAPAAPEAPVVAAPPASPAPAALPATPPARALKKAPAVDLNELTKAPAPRTPAKRARRARKPKPAPEPAPSATEETLIESHDKTAPLAPPSEPGAAPAAAAPSEDRGFLLPGVPRRVPPQSVTKQPAGSPAPNAAPAPEAADDATTKQVREQFVFCAQLLSQGAFADHFDTCLCADARQAAPYRGRRGFYATTLKKAASAGTLATSAAVTSIVLDGPVAKVTAAWKSGASEKPRTEMATWQLEDGLWCRYP
jgi:hypothetical protein